MWLSYPPVTVGQAEPPPPATPYPASDPARVRRLGSLVHDLEGGTPYSVEVDFADLELRSVELLSTRADVREREVDRRYRDSDHVGIVPGPIQIRAVVEPVLSPKARKIRQRFPLGEIRP